jgi:hypothetical protein
LSIEHDGIRVVSLPKLASGQAPHRLHDLGDVQQLIQHLDLPQQLADQLDPSLRDSYMRIWTAAQTGGREDN